MENDAYIRLTAAIGIILLIALWEGLKPRRSLPPVGRKRWFSNAGLLIFNSVLARIIFPSSALGFAALAQERGWGLLNHIHPGPLIAIFLSIIALDLAIWFQHRLFHLVPWLWRLHRVHHSDTGFDFSTGIRFHPLEIMLSLLFKAVIIFILGAPIIGVLIFEVLLNVSSIFNHGNIYIPKKVDQWLRWFIVTPDMHRVHHSSIQKETDSNFGFNLSCWDRIFSSYCAQPSLGHQEMEIGLKEFRLNTEQRIDQLLYQPLRNPNKTAD